MWSVSKQYVSVKQLIDLLNVNHHLIEQDIGCEIRKVVNNVYAKVSFDARIYSNHLQH